MKNFYVLHIPDLQQVLNYEDMAECEFYLFTRAKRCEKIRLLASNGDGCYTFENSEAYEGLLGAVRIDFDNKTILFNHRGSGSQEFEDIVFSTLSQLFVRVEKNRIQFMAFPSGRRIKRLRTRC